MQTFYLSVRDAKNQEPIGAVQAEVQIWAISHKTLSDALSSNSESESHISSTNLFLSLTLTFFSAGSTLALSFSRRELTIFLIKNR